MVEEPEGIVLQPGGGGGVRVHCSKLHAGPQPSPPMVFPSSHCSVPSRTPLPHGDGVQMEGDKELAADELDPWQSLAQEHDVSLGAQMLSPQTEHVVTPGRKGTIPQSAMQYCGPARSVMYSSALLQMPFPQECVALTQSCGQFVRSSW